MRRRGSRRQRLRKWLAHRLWLLNDKMCDIESDRITDPLLAASEWTQKALCFLLGHGPISDQCNIPDHDYCAWCNKSMPGMSEDRVPA